MIACLVPVFEMAHERFPHLIKSVPLAVDLASNFILNVYDPCRDAVTRVLSFKVALVVLCQAPLEDKYKYMFHLISTNDGVDHKRLGLLFYDLIHIPKSLGEAAAFGGSNIEPSVRSCFEYSKYPPTILIDGFLSWLKMEPQSFVWLPVMHRLASSEFAKHQVSLILNADSHGLRTWGFSFIAIRGEKQFSKENSFSNSSITKNFGTHAVQYSQQCFIVGQM